MGKERRKFFRKLPKNLTYEPMETVKIGMLLVGKGQPTFIIAEAGANHRGKIENAYKLIDKAKQAGADAVKFQHLTHDRTAADILVYDDWHDKTIGALSGFYKSAEMPYEWTEKLARYAEKLKIIFLSTPFDKEAVDVLDKAGVAAFKVASYELTEDLLLDYIASKGRPMIISTGMAYLEEVAHAVSVVNQAGNNQIILLHCVSIYPPKFADLNLRAITTLQNGFKLPVGYSDHSAPPFIAAPLAAVTLGACIIEKHLTSDRQGGSNDDPNSLETGEFKRMVEEIRNLETALSGGGIKQPVVKKNHIGDEINDRFVRRSVYARKDLAAGEVVTSDNIITLRPWGGIEPKDWHLFRGHTLRKPVKARQPITPEHFED